MALRLSEVEVIKCPNGRTLVNWMLNFKFFTPKRVHVVKNAGDELYIRIYTARNCYAIRAVGDVDRGYLGCVASRRTPRPGEDWTRGNDLPDGSFCKVVFRRILGAIVFYEALELAKESD